jgi:hypothetical protein
VRDRPDGRRRPPRRAELPPGHRALDLRALFRDALSGVGDAGLRVRLAEAADGTEAGFRVSELEAANARLRGLLIELHAHVESLDSPEARRIESAIWRELQASTERRRLALDSF